MPIASPAPPLPAIVDRVREVRPPDLPVWIVGGTVRDALLNRTLRDVDFAVQGDALGLARRVADRVGAAYYPLDPERGAGRVVVADGDDRLVLDFAQLRGPDLETDLRGRDFTLNAMAVPLDDPESLVDPLGGEADLRAGLLRACSATSMLDDPVRCLRAIRLAVQFGFRLERGTRIQVREAGPGLASAASERVRDEFMRLLGGRKPAAAIRSLDRLGLLTPILPELAGLKGVTQSPPHILDVWEHTLAVLDRLQILYAVLADEPDEDASADLIAGLAALKLRGFRGPLNRHLDAVLSADRPARWLLNLAALLHDSRKPQTRTVEANGQIRFVGHDEQGAELAEEIAQRLRLSSDEVLRLKTVVRHHMRPFFLMESGRPTRRAVYRFFRDTGEAGVDVVILSLADMLGTAGVTLKQDTWLRLLEMAETLLEARFHQPEQAVSPPSLVNGDDLMAEFNLAPGPLIGELLELVREAQAAGEVSDRAGALGVVRGRLESD